MSGNAILHVKWVSHVVCVHLCCVCRSYVSYSLCNYSDFDTRQLRCFVSFWHHSETACAALLSGFFFFNRHLHYHFVLVHFDHFAWNLLSGLFLSRYTRYAFNATSYSSSTTVFLLTSVWTILKSVVCALSAMYYMSLCSRYLCVMSASLVCIIDSRSVLETFVLQALFTKCILRAKHFVTDSLFLYMCSISTRMWYLLCYVFRLLLVFLYGRSVLMFVSRLLPAWMFYKCCRSSVLHD